MVCGHVGGGRAQVGDFDRHPSILSPLQQQYPHVPAEGAVAEGDVAADPEKPDPPPRHSPADIDAAAGACRLGDRASRCAHSGGGGAWQSFRVVVNQVFESREVGAEVAFIVEGAQNAHKQGDGPKIA